MSAFSYNIIDQIPVMLKWKNIYLDLINREDEIKSF